MDLQNIPTPNWRIVHPDDYFHHPYTKTWTSEREIELTVASRWLLENPNDVVEVGAVMPYYAEISHEVIDPYDEKATIADFMENQDLVMQNVLCISTIEHIGTTDYAVEGERQNVVDENAAIEALKQILNDSDNCLISIPIGYNHFLDAWLEENLSNLKCFGYKKIMWKAIQNKIQSLWNYYENVDSIKAEKYRHPFPLGNYILFIEGWL